MPRVKSLNNTSDGTQNIPNRAKISFVQRDITGSQQLCLACFSGDEASTKKLLSSMKLVEDVRNFDLLLIQSQKKLIKK